MAVPASADSARDPDELTGPKGLRISRRDVNEVFAHALGGVPNEVCGAFLGLGDRVDEVSLLSNADESPYTYSIDSRELNDVFKRGAEAGLDVIGNFHSHTRTDAYPSPTDVRQAEFLADWIHALVSLKYEEPVLRAYRIIDGEIIEIPVTVEA